MRTEAVGLPRSTAIRREAGRGEHLAGRKRGELGATGGEGDTGGREGGGGGGGGLGGGGTGGEGRPSGGREVGRGVADYIGGPTLAAPMSRFRYVFQ